MSRHIEEEYLLLTKLKEMNDEYFEKWKRLRDVYAQTLNYGSIIQSVGFTPHTYDKHCVNMYQILSNILIPESAYGNFLSADDLFSLCTAVLFHDFYMALDSTERHSHGQLGSNLFLDKLYTPDTGISIYVDDRPIGKAVAEIVFGHSDIKNKDTEEVEIFTIDVLINKYKERNLSGPYGSIKILFLAALMRLADELDIQFARVSGINYEMRKIPEKSAPHWEKCELFDRPSKHPTDGKVILLNVDDDKLKRTENKEKAIGLIIQVRDKIASELSNLYDKILNNNSFSVKGWTIKEVMLSADDETMILVDEYEKKINAFASEVQENLNNEEQKKNDKDGLEDKFFEKDSIPSMDLIIDESFSQKINNWIISNGLFKSGHYIIDEASGSSARDWIDIQGLLEDNDCFSEIALKLIDNYKFGSDSFVIGINFGGMLLASYIGFKTGNPFTYFIPKHSEKKFGEHEIRIEPIKDKKIIIVMDAIVTGQSLQLAIDELITEKIIDKHNIDRIYCVLLRKPTSESKNIMLEVEYLKKLKVLNSSFPIEICKNTANCSFKKYGINKYNNRAKE